MSEAQARHAPEEEAPGWRVRAAAAGDAAAVAAAVRALLQELGGAPPAHVAMEATARGLIADPDDGAILVAEAGGALVGVLAVAWPVAIHAGGRYGLIQDLWVDPAWRSRAVGRGLLDALDALAAMRAVARLEVGLPRESFSRLEATRRFYLDNGFTPLGARLRRSVP